ENLQADGGRKSRQGLRRSGRGRSRPRAASAHRRRKGLYRLCKDALRHAPPDCAGRPAMTKDNGAQKTSPAYILPALDSEFLLGDSTRGVRLHLEYQKAEEILRSWTVRSTIVVFGSARVRPSDAPDGLAATSF